MCSGTNHPWPVPFPPHTPPTTLALWPLQPLRHASISRFCTCCSLYLERSFPSNQAGLPPYFSKVFAQMSSSEWSFSWSPYYKLQIHTHTYIDILCFLSLAYFSPQQNGETAKLFILLISVPVRSIRKEACCSLWHPQCLEWFLLNNYLLSDQIRLTECDEGRAKDDAKLWRSSSQFQGVLGRRWTVHRSLF